MEVGIVGKANVGKSTTFNALTLLDVPVAPYPFTTLKPNRGVGAVRAPCPHAERGVPCTPGNSKCVDGVRWVPINLIDVPGLVPGAHEGKGLGREFLDELRGASGFLHVVDGAGATAPDGVPATPGSFDPAEEVQWLDDELIEWVTAILSRDFLRLSKSIELVGGPVEELLQSRLTGLAISPGHIAAALRETPVDRAHPARWTEAERRALAKALLRTSKPRWVAWNKADRTTPAALAELTERIAPVPSTPTSAEAELTLRRAQRAGLVRYTPGAATFEVTDPEKLNAAQLRALEEIRGILRTWGTTGVQAALERLVFDGLHQIVVFPVEDEQKWTDSKGRVLPDAFLVPAGTAVRAFAYRIHTDLGENFLKAVDARTHRALAAEHPLEAGAVIRVVTRR
ncbi:MAG TPA: redox-regulated ATPase YchF [Thermoplasmata archaeon]|nr:redox-regulated ATPase YchF [Thermoplasmata archaeon]